MVNVLGEVVFGVVVRGLNVRVRAVVPAGWDRSDWEGATCGPKVLVERVELGRHLDVVEALDLADAVLSRFSKSDRSDACLAATAALGPRVTLVREPDARLRGLRTFMYALRRCSSRLWVVRGAVRDELTNEPGRWCVPGLVRPVVRVRRSLGVTVAVGAAAALLSVRRPVPARLETACLDRSVE